MEEAETNLCRWILITCFDSPDSRACADIEDALRGFVEGSKVQLVITTAQDDMMADIKTVELRLKRVSQTMPIRTIVLPHRWEASTLSLGLVL